MRDILTGLGDIACWALLQNAADCRSRAQSLRPGDDGAAKAEVGRLIERLGFIGLDLGSLAVGSRLAQFPGGPLATHNLVKFG